VAAEVSVEDVVDENEPKKSGGGKKKGSKCVVM
jgi:hypothetical protein